MMIKREREREREREKEGKKEGRGFLLNAAMSSLILCRFLGSVFVLFSFKINM